MAEAVAASMAKASAQAMRESAEVEARRRMRTDSGDGFAIEPSTDEFHSSDVERGERGNGYPTTCAGSKNSQSPE
jgi:hypothetical protein